MSELSCLIEDGYTRDGYIDAVPNLHGCLRFKYRPLIPEQREKLFTRLNEYPGDAHTTTVNLLASRIVEWSLKVKGKEVGVGVVNVRKLQPRIFDRIYNMIVGREGGDTDPEAKVSEEANSKKSADAALAEILGTSPSTAMEINDAKN